MGLHVGSNSRRRCLRSERNARQELLQGGRYQQRGKRSARAIFEGGCLTRVSGMLMLTLTLIPTGV